VKRGLSGSGNDTAPLFDSAPALTDGTVPAGQHNNSQ
jgi:hypothetical protein